MPTRQRGAGSARRAWPWHLSPCLVFPVSSGIQLRSGRDRFPVCGLPTPRTRAITAFRNALLVDLRDHVAVTGEQRLGGAHLGTQRQLALGQTVGPVFLV